MLGSSRDSLAALQQVVASGQWGAQVDGVSATAADLLRVVGPLSDDKALRTALADSGQPAEARQALARDIFAARVNEGALNLIVQVAGSRWSNDGDIVEAIEALAAQIIFSDADAAGVLDRVEEEIFLFARAVDANPELQMALTNPALPKVAKAGVVHDVVASQAVAATTHLLQHAASNLRGRRVDAALKTLSDLAASQRNRIVADVTVATALSPEQASRLAAVLARLAGREVSLNIVVDPAVIGGVSVRLGDEVIDGSVRTRLEQARRVLVG